VVFVGSKPNCKSKKFIDAEACSKAIQSRPAILIETADMLK
jgi:hypothetical protein